MNPRCHLTTIVVFVVCVAVHAQGGVSGKWQGTTPSGEPIVLDVKVKAERLTGTVSLGGQTVQITDGTADATTCTFKVTVDDRPHTFNGRLVGEGLELSSEDIEKPVTLQRVKSPA